MIYSVLFSKPQTHVRTFICQMLASWRFLLELINKFQIAPKSLSNTFVALLNTFLIVSLDKLPESWLPITQILHGVSKSRRHANGVKSSLIQRKSTIKLGSYLFHGITIPSNVPILQISLLAH